jgi:hypothetical protein
MENIMGRWRRRWDYPEREKRPKAKKLTDSKKKEILDKLNEGINASPVLAALQFRFRALRGRFYLERMWTDIDGNTHSIVMGRITPLYSRQKPYLFETETSRNNWYKIVQGSIAKIINSVTTDTKGTFHGLGTLDKSLRQEGAVKKRLKVTMSEDLQFSYMKSGGKCSIQEALYHYFGLPIDVIAEPRGWYECHRTPQIVEVSEDCKSILVRFVSSGIMGSFHGTCLYTKIENEWHVFTIRPNQSKNISTALAWLEKRGWVDWV